MILADEKMPSIRTREICARICVYHIFFVSNYTMSKTNEPGAFIDYLLPGQYL